MFYLLQANKIKKSKNHTLTMIVEGEKKDIDRRTYNNSLSNVVLEEYTANPAESTNIVGIVDDLKFWVKNGTIKEVAYLFIYLGFSLQSINTTNQQYSDAQVQQLISAISKKLANQQAVSQLQQGEKRPTIQIETNTEVEETPTPPITIEKKEIIEPKSKDTIQTDDEENFLDIAQHALPDIDKIITESGDSQLFHNEREALKNLREKISTAISTSSNNGLGESISQAMVLMETIELGMLQAEAEIESTDIAESLHADIIGVKDHEEGQDQKSSLIGESTVTSIKKHVSSGNTLLSNLQKRLQWIVLFTILEVGGVSLYNLLTSGTPFSSSISYRPQAGIIALATLLWSFTRKKTIGIKIGSFIVLIVLSIVAIHRIAANPW